MASGNISHHGCHAQFINGVGWGPRRSMALLDLLMQEEDLLGLMRQALKI